MGCNTVVFLLNDEFGHIERHPDDTVTEIKTGMVKCRNDLPYKFTGGQVVSCDHADAAYLIAAGGNTVQVLATKDTGGHIDDEHMVKLLKEAAERYGYRLVKKPQARTKRSYTRKADPRSTE